MPEQQHHSELGPILLGIGLLGGGYLLYKKVIKPDLVVPLQTKNYVERMKIGKIQGVHFKKDTIEFKFPIENPNVKPMEIDAIVADIFITDKKTNQPMKLGSIYHYGKSIIKPLGATEFDLVVKINLVTEFVELSKLFGGTFKGQVLTLKGTVTVNGKPWPVTERIDIA